MQERQQRLDAECVEDFNRRERRNDVADRVDFNVACSALIQVEEDVVITAALQHLLHLGIEFVELLTSILDAKVELRHVLLDFGDERSGIRFQQIGGLFVEVIQDEQACHVPPPASLRLLVF
ncbi:hypothetical protein [Bradyrhizobium sp. 138]|uniref:hypothetical protein n=1 Tax=Bradyrhizobium sp. 138 TaxID=2782615 RepID=UPI001FF72C68|nr:hypothetical protein [Bradyrhizobium sp. 138]